MLDWLSGTALGAVVGSGLSVWWRKPVRWLVQFVAGVFIGWWGGDYIIIVVGMPESYDIGRAVGGAISLISFSVMEKAMVTNWGDLAGKIVDKAASMRGAGK